MSCFNTLKKKSKRDTRSSSSKSDSDFQSCPRGAARPADSTPQRVPHLARAPVPAGSDRPTASELDSQPGEGVDSEMALASDSDEYSCRCGESHDTVETAVQVEPTQPSSPDRFPSYSSYLRTESGNQPQEGPRVKESLTSLHEDQRDERAVTWGASPDKGFRMDEGGSGRQETPESSYQQSDTGSRRFRIEKGNRSQESSNSSSRKKKNGRRRKGSSGSSHRQDKKRDSPSSSYDREKAINKRYDKPNSGYYRQESVDTSYDRAEKRSRSLRRSGVSRDSSQRSGTYTSDVVMEESSEEDSMSPYDLSFSGRSRTSESNPPDRFPSYSSYLRKQAESERVQRQGVQPTSEEMLRNRCVWKGSWGGCARVRACVRACVCVCVWCVVSCRVVSCRVVAWRGVAWRGVAWRGVAWRGVAWRGVAWRGVAWCSCSSGRALPLRDLCALTLVMETPCPV